MIQASCSEFNRTAKGRNNSLLGYKEVIYPQKKTLGAEKENGKQSATVTHKKPAEHKAKEIQQRLSDYKWLIARVTPHHLRRWNAGASSSLHQNPENVLHASGVMRS